MIDSEVVFKDRLKSFLIEKQNGVSIDDIFTHVKGDTFKVKKTLQTMVCDGEVLKLGKGRAYNPFIYSLKY